MSAPDIGLAYVPEDIPFTMFCMSGVWSLTRLGRVYMRSRNADRVAREMARVATERCVERGRAVRMLRLNPDGSRVECAVMPRDAYLATEGGSTS